MKTTRFVFVATAAVLATFSAAERDASAAGTSLDIQSARGTGMASATTAMIDDSSAIYYNPAGIAQGKTFDAQAGINLIVPSFNYTSPGGTKTTLPFSVVTPFQVYASGGITDDLSIGIGLFNPFGLKLQWPDGWAGSHLISTSDLRTFYINPTVAYKFGPLRIGAGLQIVRATVELKKDIGFGDQTGGVDLAGSAWGVGGNVGVQLEAIKQFLSFGVHYRSAVKLAFDDGLAHFNNVPADLQGIIHDQAVKTSIVQPDSLAMGVATHPIKNLVLDLDAVWFGWSHFKAINLNFPDDRSGSLSTVQPKNWNNTVNLHLGAEGILSDHWLLRGGVMFDPSPSPSSTLTPDTPDATRVNLALGGTWRHESGVHIDAGYQFIILTGKTSTQPQLPGDYGGFVNILGLAIGYTTPMKKEPVAFVDPAAGSETPPPPMDAPPPSSAPPPTSPDPGIAPSPPL